MLHAIRIIQMANSLPVQRLHHHVDICHIRSLLIGRLLAQMGFFDWNREAVRELETLLRILLA